MSFHRNGSAVGIVSVIVSALILGTSGSAMAAEDQPAPARSVVEDVNEAAPALDVAQGADVSSTRAAAIVSSAGEGASQVVVPRSAAAGVRFSTEDGDALSIGLPLSTQALSTQAQPAQVVEGTAVYGDQTTDVSVAVQPIGDGSVRALIAIPDAQAPAEYRFPVTVPPGGGIELMEDGSVEIINGEGETIAVFAPAWAKDANGKDLASSYRVEGNTVVQTVDLAAADAFPVIADPWVQGDCGRVTCTVRFAPSGHSQFA